MNYFPNLNNEALERANDALSIIEQVSLICDQLTNLEQTISLGHKAEVVAITARAKAVLASIDDSDSEAVLSLVKEERGVTKLAANKIESLGIGNEIIRLREEHGMTYEVIAEKFHLNPATVSKYCKLYSKSSPLEKSKVRSKSVMDFVNNWETIGASIYRQLARLENDPENHVKYISELRQLSKDIEKFQSKYTAQQQVEQIKEVVIEILRQELPEKRAQIQLRFSEIGISRYLQPGK